MHRSLYRLLLLAASFVLPACGAAQRFPPDVELTSLLESRVADGRAVGIVLGVLEPDGSTRILVAGSAGTGAQPLGAETVFEIGSITKVFTATLLAEMVRRGEVRLDDPVARYLPDSVRVPSRGGREITLVDLATHTSALPRLPGNMAPADPTNPYADYTVEQLDAFLASYELPRDIGATAEYSNLGVGLLGHALARAGGMPYEALLRERVLDPLGLADTRIELTDALRSRMAQGHDAQGNPTPLWDLPTLAGAGALRSDVGDMLRFLAANVGPPTTELEEAMRVAHQRRSPRPGTAPGEPGIALNWIVQPAGGSTIVWHNGGTGGFRSFVGFDPELQQGVVVLANTVHSVDDIGLHLLNRSIPLTEAPRQRTEVTVSPEILDDYVGEYQLAPQFSIVVTMEGGTLSIQATNQERLPISAESENAFFLRAVDAQITFQRDAAGTVTGLVLHQGGQNVPGRRIR